MLGHDGPAVPLEDVLQGGQRGLAEDGHLPAVRPEDLVEPRLLARSVLDQHLVRVGGVLQSAQQRLELPGPEPSLLLLVGGPAAQDDSDTGAEHCLPMGGGPSLKVLQLLSRTLEAS